MAQNNTPLYRIVSLAPPLTEILGYLGFSYQVTAIDEYYEDVPPTLDVQKPEYWYTMAEGRVESLRPELVLTMGLSQWDLHKRFKEKGYNAIHLDPRSLRDVEDCFRQIGKEAGAQEQARLLAADFAGSLEGLKDRIPPGAYRPKLYCEDWSKPPTVPGGWYPELMTAAGAHYFPMLPREASREVRFEEVLKFDPEIMVFAIRGTEGVDFNPDEVLKRFGWEKINAVKKRRLYTVDQILLNRPSLRLFEGAKCVQQILGQSFWGWPLTTSSSIRKVLD